MATEPKRPLVMTTSTPHGESEIYKKWISEAVRPRTPADFRREYMGDFSYFGGSMTATTAPGGPAKPLTTDDLIKAAESIKAEEDKKIRGATFDKIWVDELIGADITADRITAGTITADKLSHARLWPDPSTMPRGRDRIRAALEEKSRAARQDAAEVAFGLMGKKPAPAPTAEKERGPEWGSW